jgi:5-methylthioadenosine/S-adenosylhomocysteine deaminase
VSILIHGGAVMTMTGVDYDSGYVLIGENGLIADLGAGEPPPNVRDAARAVVDAAGKVVLPGLVNAHTHLSQTFMRGLGDDRPLMDWLKGVVWPMQAAMTPDDVYLATLLGLVENITCGVTSLIKHHKITNSPAHNDAALRAMLRVGLPATLAYGWVDMGANAPPVEASVAEMERLRAAAQGSPIRVAVGPMAPWRCTDEAIRRTFALAEAWDVPFHLHVAEAEAEVGLMIQRNGMRHVEWLAALDVLSPRTQLVHSVWLSAEEVDLIAERGAQVIHCPTSNMYLASGTAKVPEMLRRGIPVALGTDGPGSNNSQDMLELLKITALLAKIDTMNATALLPADVLRMATVAGARATGQGGGTLEVGAPARIIVVDIDTPRGAPVHSPASALVYSATGPDVDAVIIGTQFMVRGKQVQGIDVPALLAECREAARRLVARAGLGEEA